MVYLRAKQIRGKNYLYLVQSKWDPKRNTAKQEIIKYLGNASKVLRKDIPMEYRNDPKVLSLLAAYSPTDVKKREEAIKKARKELYRLMTEGDAERTLGFYNHYTNYSLSSLASFFEDVLKPVMYKIGNDWESKKISIATEHVASNIATSLVKTIFDKIKKPPNKKKTILICVPIGEEHHLACDILEVYLSSKGFKVFNLSASVPTVSIIDFIQEHKPSVVLVSVTLNDNIKAGQRLVNNIHQSYKNISLYAGGLAFQNNDIPKFNGVILKDEELERLPKIFSKV